MSYVLPPIDIRTLPRTESGIVELDPRWINVDAQRFQFKSGGDEFGVTERLRGVKDFDPHMCGWAMVWEDKDGHLFIADGHQRHGLCRRALAHGQEGIKLPCRVYREVDGISAEDVKVKAAHKNIAEGTGTALDVATVIRSHGSLPEHIPANGKHVKLGKQLAQLTPDTLRAVANGVISEEFGGIITATLTQAQQTGFLSEEQKPEMEKAVLNAFLKYKPTPEQAGHIASEVLRTGLVKEEESGLLFGELAERDDIMRERSEILQAAEGLLRDERTVMRTFAGGGSKVRPFIRGEIDREGVVSREQQLTVALEMLGKGFRYNGMGDGLESAAGELQRLRKRPGDNVALFAKQLQAALDDPLSEAARELKASRVKGDNPNDTALRREFARKFLDHVEDYVANSVVAKQLLQTLSRKNDTGEDTGSPGGLFG